ncbi:MAG: NAD(P)H-hydrate epimerase, partial [Myxococcota bacterium]
MSVLDSGTRRAAPRWPLVTASEMRALDQYTIETLGVPGDLLMESAGRAVAHEVLRTLDPGEEVVIVCGRGNNGGDGLVVSRQLHLLGVRVRVALLAEPSELVGDAARNWQRAVAAGVSIEGYDWSPPSAGVIVDSVFGTGLSRDVGGPIAEALVRINICRDAGRTAIIAVDLPSGLCADTGAVLGTAVVADTTVVLGLPKLGLALEPARSHAGRVVVARIGIADSAPGVTPRAELWMRSTAGQNLPVRAR